MGGGRDGEAVGLGDSGGDGVGLGVGVGVELLVLGLQGHVASCACRKAASPWGENLTAEA